jgi:hypothetical protein
MNRKDIENMQALYESVITEAVDDRMVKRIIANVLKDFDSGKFTAAKEALDTLKGLKVAGQTIADMPEYSDIVSGLEQKIMGGARDKADLEKRTREEYQRVRTPEAIMADAKQCVFKNAQLGYMNGWEEGGWQYKVRELHSMCKERDPDQHVTVHQHDTIRGDHGYECSCGYSDAVDSSD